MIQNKENQLREILVKHKLWLENSPDGERADLSDANMHGAKLIGAKLRNADLHGANLTGADLRNANLRNANLRDANLRDAKLCNADMRGAELSFADMSNAFMLGSNLAGADMRGAKLCNAKLCNADMRDAKLRNADMRGANLIGANVDLHKSLRLPPPDPDLPRRVAAQALKPGGLNMRGWHTCETTHCLAGWAIHLTGLAGYALEQMTSSWIAGAILMPSAKHLFHASNEEAIEWLKAQLEGGAE